MEEILCSLHNYTKFSGYPYSFYNMAQEALDCGLDAVITTDKNIFPVGHNQYYYRSKKKLMVVCGEELFDPLNDEIQHYLSVGIDREQFNKDVFVNGRSEKIRYNGDDTILFMFGDYQP